jgi:hypothetical protein
LPFAGSWTLAKEKDLRESYGRRALGTREGHPRAVWSGQRVLRPQRVERDLGRPGRL